ncbi:MAG TPA: tetratricopeptide repeat protein [Acidobacteriaceae bacterium]|nr:tetratricopeptide repeat protein [Acidobacteriaceae bacterium]
MMRIAKVWMPAVASLSMLLATTGCSKLKARDQLNKGVQAYKNARYEEAIEHFQTAVNLDPSLTMTHMYLATAYAQQVVPNSDTAANAALAQHAIAGYKDALQIDPSNVNAIKGIASIYFSMNKPDDAKAWQQKVLAADPKDPEAYYTIGVIDWNKARKNSLQVLADNGLTDKGDGNPGLPKKACEQLAAMNGPLIDEALDVLHKAVDLRPSYEDAMAYINLTYRRKAEIECGNADARKADVQQALDWTQKALGARKANVEKANQATKPGVDTNK